MANEYATSAELKSTLELSGESYADADVALALTAASRGIDIVTQRRFWKDADANQVRFYGPDRITRDRHTGQPKLWIDDLVDFTSLKTDPSGDGTFPETWVQNSDFVLEPLNAAADGRPKTKVLVHPNSSFSLPCSYPRSVELTGRFGWPAVPEPIKEATMILAGKLQKRVREAPFGVAGIGIDNAAIRIARTDPDVAFLIGPYTLPTG